MECFRCKKEIKNEVPYFEKLTKGTKYLCECGHVMYEISFRHKENQDRLNAAFAAKKAELQNEH